MGKERLPEELSPSNQVLHANISLQTCGDGHSQVLSSPSRAGSALQLKKGQEEGKAQQQGANWSGTGHLCPLQGQASKAPA